MIRSATSRRAWPTMSGVGARGKRVCPGRAHGAVHIPRVGGDEPHAIRFDAELSGRVPVHLWRGIEFLYGADRECPLEKLCEVGVGELLSYAVR
jgi:hypothetical protein